MSKDETKSQETTGQATAGLFERLAITELGVEKFYEWNGARERFVIARIADFAEYEKITRHQNSRNKALSAHKGKLPVKLPAELAAPWTANLGEHKVLEDGAYEVYLTSQAAIHVATRLELGLREPVLNWAQAVLFLKLNWQLASEIVHDFMVVNGEDAKAEAKKDSKPTGDEEDSEP